VGNADKVSKVKESQTECYDGGGVASKLSCFNTRLHWRQRGRAGDISIRKGCISRDLLILPKNVTDREY